MNRNLRKYGAATVVGLSMVATFGIANADCRKDDGLSRDGSVGPVELLTLCAEQDKREAADAAAKTEVTREQLAQRGRVSAAASYESMDSIR